MKKVFTVITGIMSIVFFLGCDFTKNNPESKKPLNILLITADDVN